MEEEKYIRYCRDLKVIMFELLRNGNSGHIGGSLSAIDALAVIYQEFIKNSTNKFVFSKGHCELAIYSILLKERILESHCIKELKIFGSKLQGHPNCHWINELDYSAGSLGQGLSFALGLAISGKCKGYSVYTMIGDGEMQEGQIWEAVMCAPRLNLGNLNVIIDCNGLQLEGITLSTNNAESMSTMWENFGWNVVIIENGHDIRQLCKGLYIYKDNNIPTAYFIKTIKGHGISYMENSCDYHGVNLTNEQVEQSLLELGEGR